MLKNTNKSGLKKLSEKIAPTIIIILALTFSLLPIKNITASETLLGTCLVANYSKADNVYGIDGATFSFSGSCIPPSGTTRINLNINYDDAGSVRVNGTTVHSTSDNSCSIKNYDVNISTATMTPGNSDSVSVTTINSSCAGTGGDANFSFYGSAPTPPSSTPNQTPLPTVGISANPTSVAYSGSSVLTWSSTNATSCTGTGGTNGWASGQNISGTFSTGALTNSTTYGITCTNSAGSANASATVTVSAQQQNNTSGTGSINITNTNTNTNTNYGSGGTPYYSYQQPTYTPPTYYPPSYTYPTYQQNPTVTISADRTNLLYGENTIVRWYPVNATSCYGTGGSNNWATSRNAYGDSFYTGPLYFNVTYTITCTNSSGGSATNAVTVTVGGQNVVQTTFVNNRPTVVLTADQENLAYNGATTLRWYTTNAATCFASGGSLGWVGAKSIGPASFYTGSLTASRSYTITCNNSYGSATDSVVVSVRGLVTTVAPTPTSLVLINSSVDRTQPIVPTIDNTQPHPGDEINYTVKYQNIGTGSITNLALQMNLPSEVDYLFSTPANPAVTGNNLVFTLGTLRANGEGTVTVRVRVRENIPQGTNLNFPATLTYNDPSGNPQSVSANVSAQVWKEDVTTTPNTSAEQPTTVVPLGANVFGAGFLPTNLFGWLLLVVLGLLLLLLARYLYGQMVPREKIVYLTAPPTPPSH